MTIEERINKYFEENLEEYEVDTIDEAKAIEEENWGEGGSRGYGIFYDDHYTPYGTGFTCINRIDEMGIYDGDISAAIQAEKDGMCKLIHDIKIPKGMGEICYVAPTIIDTPENRELLIRMINEYTN